MQPPDTSCWDLIHIMKTLVHVYYRMNCSHNINDDISLPLYMLFCYEIIIPGIIVQRTNDDGTIFQGTNVQGASVSVSAVVCGDFHPELECLLVQLLLLLLFLLLLRNSSQSFFNFTFKMENCTKFKLSKKCSHQFSVCKPCRTSIQ